MQGRIADGEHKPEQSVQTLSEPWQPIYTAPKTGEKILAYTWQAADDYCDEAFGAVQIISWDFGNDHLDRMWARAAGWDQQLIGNPTHWMQLPAPPALGEGALQRALAGPALDETGGGE